MGTFQKLENLIMPQEVDFFARLQEQSALVKRILEGLHDLHTAEGGSPQALLGLIREAEELRLRNLKELYMVFLTPVDKEAISRAYIDMDWVVMSVKHLEVELEVYGLRDLGEYKAILDLLRQEMGDIHEGFGMLHARNEELFSRRFFHVVGSDNDVIGEYARQVSALLSGTDMKKILIRKEVLNQLKEISKRIRMCANDLEDMLFKMN